MYIFVVNRDFFSISCIPLAAYIGNNVMIINAFRRDLLGDAELRLSASTSDGRDPLALHASRTKKMLLRTSRFFSGADETRPGVVKKNVNDFELLNKY
jgi:hypothetical protein